MPTYRYECACGKSKEISHSIHEEPELECDNCQGAMVRVPQAPSVSFRGSGFYTTDKKKSSK